MKKVLALLFCLGVLLYLMLIGHGISAAEKPTKIAVVGVLEQIMAIGGETTSWAVRLDHEQEIGGKKVKEVEVDPAGLPIEKYKRKHVEIKGELISRHGVERDYVVIKIESVREVLAR